MADSRAYQSDLAYVHDRGFGDFARQAGPGVLEMLREAGILEGQIVDLGCGSGIWAEQLVHAGFHVVGVDISPAMIDIAARRNPDAEFHVESFLRYRIPACRAVTALGEVFNYLFDERNSLQSLHDACSKVFAALEPGGLFIFDVAQPGRRSGIKQAFWEGDDWACLTEYQHDESGQRLGRRIITFRKVDDRYRRHEETHQQQLYEQGDVEQMLRAVGFDVETKCHYGSFALPDRLIAFVAKKQV